MDVVTAHPTSLVATDPSRLDELPSGTRVYGIPVEVSFAERLDAWLTSLVQSVRGRLGGASSSRGAAGNTVRSTVSAPVRINSLPASDIGWDFSKPRTLIRAYHAYVIKSKWHGWANAAEFVAKAIVEASVHRAVISCGPPHEAHEAARRVSLATGLPLMLDMRDPWSLVERLPEPVASPVWLRWSARDEQRAMARASIAICNTDPSRRALAAAYPNTSARIITVMNGYDEEPIPSARRGRRFTIAYAGNIYIDRDPRLLFRAAARVIADLGLTPEDFGLDFVGNVEMYDGVPVSQIACEEGMAAFVTVSPSLPRPAMLEFLAGASMLVSLPQDSDLAVPSKLFEYMQFDAWLLALADVDSATELLLRDSGADVRAPHDVQGMTAVLHARYQQYARGVRPGRLARDGRFSRRGQAKILLDALEDVVGSASPARIGALSAPGSVV
ncbi:MAG: hypothetical protein ACR2G6_13550 [Gemmatimonadaceae bacterium]